MPFDPLIVTKSAGGLQRAAGQAPAPGNTRGLSGLTLHFNVLFGGQFKVVGTVKYKNTPANTPLKRKVFLLREPDMRLIATTWSDATTGAYSFLNVAGGCTYTVLSVDYTHNYRAVIADNLAPEAM